MTRSTSTKSSTTSLVAKAKVSKPPVVDTPVVDTKPSFSYRSGSAIAYGTTWTAAKVVNIGEALVPISTDFCSGFADGWSAGWDETRNK